MRGLRVVALPRLARVGVDRLDRQLHELCLARAADQDLRPRPRPLRSGSHVVRNGRQAPSPPSSRPRRRRTGGRRRSRAGRGSAPRRDAPTAAPIVLNTSSPRCRRTSSSTSAESRVRPSTIVSRTPAIASRGFEARLDDVHRAQQLGEPLERVVLGLHRDEHAVGGGERVHGQRARARAGSRGRRRRSRSQSLPASRRETARRRHGGRARPPRRRGRASRARARGSGIASASPAARAARRRAGRSWTFRSPPRRAPRSRSPAGRGRRRAPSRRPRRGRRRG